MKKSRGITLIALVITIIVILVLAGITLSMVLGDNGVLDKARTAKSNTDIASEKEQILLAMNSSFGNNGTDAKVIDKVLMENNLKASVGKNKVKVIADVEEDAVFYVKFEESKRFYEIDENRNVNLIEVTGGEKELTIKCIDGNKAVLETKKYTILKDNFSKTLPIIEGYMCEQEKLTGKITEDTTIEVMYYVAIPESQIVFTGLTSSGGITTDSNKIVSYMVGDNSTTNGNGLVSVPEVLAILKIPETHNGKPVTKIGQYAFRNASKIGILNICNNITSIGNYGIYSCSGITKAIIGSGLNSIGTNGFASCSALKTVIYNNETNIIKEFGNGWGNWTEIQLSETNTSLKLIDNILYSKDGTTIVKVPVGRSGSFTIADGVTTVGEKAFWRCSKITEVNIGNNVTSIGGNGFASCTGMTKLTIGSGLNSIGSNGFNSCSALKTIIYNNETNIVSQIGNGCGAWTEIQVSESNPSLKVVDNILYSKDGTTIVKVPSGISENFVIPDGVTTIGTKAFWCCSKLTEINLGNNVTSVGSTSFSSCTGMTKLTIGSGLNSIGSNGFNSCSALKTIVYNNETDIIKEIGNGCGAWTEIQVSDSNPSLKVVDNILYSKDGATIVKVPSGISGNYIIPAGVTTIGAKAFWCCSKITEIDLGNNVTSIGGNGFGSCSGMTKLTIGSGLNSIGSNAFNSCSVLKTIVYNNETDVIKAIGNGCGAWTEIQVSESNPNLKVVNNILYSKDGSKIVKVPSGVSGSFTVVEGVTQIGADAFCRCTKLTEIDIGNNVITIGNNGFASCTGITKVTIRSNVTSIGTNAFNSCSALKTVIIDSSTIATNLSSQTACGKLVNSATTVYTKITPGSYITTNFKTTSSDLSGYTKYVKK